MRSLPDGTRVAVVLTLLVLGFAAWAFLLLAFGIESITRRLREDPPGYVDTSRGSRDV